jgi:hypothetical protein
MTLKPSFRPVDADHLKDPDLRIWMRLGICLIWHVLGEYHSAHIPGARFAYQRVSVTDLSCRT